MKKVQLTWIMILACTSMFAQNGFQNKCIEILPKSSLTITGDTNINEFFCEFNTALISKNKEIKFSKEESSICFEDALLTLENTGFDCGNKAINKDFHVLIQTDQYPEITLELKKITFNDNNRAIANVILSIAGKNKNYSVPIEILPKNSPHFKGVLKLNINDFELTPPKKFFGMVVVKNEIEINFNLSVLN